MSQWRACFGSCSKVRNLFGSGSNSSQQRTENRTTAISSGQLEENRSTATTAPAQVTMLARDTTTLTEGVAHSPVAEDPPNIQFPKGVTRFQVNDLKRGIWAKHVIGRGATSTVYKGIVNGKPVAIKSITPGKMQLDTFLTELDNMCTLRGENIVNLVGFSIEGNEQYLVYEYMKEDLHAHLFNQQVAGPSWKMRINIALGIAKGLQFIHSNGMIHADLKPANILLDQHLQAKITDFGFAKKLPDGESFVALKTVVEGTPGYMDPEILKGVQTQKADIYALGAILVDLVRGVQTIPKTVPANLSDEIIIYKGYVRSQIDWYLSRGGQDDVISCAAVPKRIRRLSA